MRDSLSGKPKDGCLAKHLHGRRVNRFLRRLIRPYPVICGW
jgi:hypothetical protein